ncbi:hypothetical protein EES41_12130 [Streptomyces sp. ADI95-16]|uniref:hypothetical protein n=1 Tax=Streptomyces sp. ADI95-16 TaxID=1522758 RepID=UPI000F434C52|nr:hypothetical protein [Streptomyces sp. ADI95-16]AYV27475.1 hypothetical protein EES41_12130 [Streptomyces sp. ADI95-16]
MRHFYASVLLDSGENIKALSTYLGHGDPGFTLRVYTHLMPSSHERALRALDEVYKAADPTADGPQTAQEGRNGSGPAAECRRPGGVVVLEYRR